MNKKLLNLIPYTIGLIYLAYCLFNINYWVKSHLGFGFYILIPWSIATGYLIISLILKIFSKKKLNFYLPIFFFIIGLIINVIGSNIPCCCGG